MTRSNAGTVQLRLNTANQDDVAYYDCRVREERALAAAATKDVARSAHLALAVIYEDHLRWLSRHAA